MPRAVDGQLQSAINALQARVNADPEIQAILAQNRAQLQRTRNRGGSDRDFQQSIRDRITAIAKRKGYIPRTGQYFVNPNDGQLEPHGGWAGLSNATRIAIIAAAAAGGLGIAGAAGAFGGAAAGAGGAAGGAGAASSVLPSASIAGLHTAVPAAIASGGASAGIPIAAGAGGALVSSAIPGAHTAVPSAISSQGASGAGGLLASGSVPGLHTAVPSAIKSQGASQGLGKLLPTIGNNLRDAGGNLLRNLASPQGVASLASLIPALIASRGGGGDSSGQNQDFINRAYEDARRQNLMQQARYRRVDPLHEAVTQLAFSRLPTSAQQGITVPRVPLPE